MLASTMSTRVLSSTNRSCFPSNIVEATFRQVCNNKDFHSGYSSTVYATCSLGVTVSFLYHDNDDDDNNDDNDDNE